MRKLLATIRIYENEQEEGSRSGNNIPVQGEHIIDLAPIRDAQLLGITPTRESKATLLAHELGHVVNAIVGDPVQDDMLLFRAHMLGDGSLLIPSERKAWERAKQIRPRLDLEVAKKAFNSYGGEF